MINYWVRLEKLQNNKLLKKCLNIQKEYCNEINTANGNSWFKKVKYILNCCNIDDNVNILSSATADKI